MGRRADFMHDVRLASARLGGSKSSISQRRRSGELLADFLSLQGGLPTKLSSVRADCLPSLAEYLQARYTHTGTLQNKIGAIRQLLRAAQVDVSGYASNKAIGLLPKSRKPGKLPYPDDQLAALYLRALALDKGFMLCLQVERLLGPRGLEALMSPKTLVNWILQASQSSQVKITSGTKGGRPRVTELIFAKRVETLSVLGAAVAHMESNGGYLLNGPSSNLKSARSLYHRLCRSVGLVKPYSAHSLRYAYCVDKLIELIALGYSMAEACREVAQFLGHGAGRGRYVRSIYGSTVVDTIKRNRHESMLSRLAAIAVNTLDAKRHSLRG
jgi:hypothetical protein